MEIREFLEAKPVFTKRDIDDYLQGAKPDGYLSRVALVARLRRAGRVVMVRRGLFVSVPGGENPESFRVDHFGVAGTLTSDAVISYRSALEFHGLAGPAQGGFEMIYSAVRPLPQFSFRGLVYRGVKFPKSLIRNGLQDLMVVTYNFNQVILRVTSPERSLVDVIDRPDLVGGWSKALELLANLTAVDLDAVIDYTKVLGNSTTAAKVGYYLAGRSVDLGVKRRHLSALSALKPNQPHYLDRSRRRNGRLVSEWNLMVDR
ncbi:MAG: transcriptional regulator [Deltaproteobacteria bacterium]|jgi:predicted transcriptional regulator of viral defense system|nr:transcriptional regulator [Deltaproteobacteria bacterium]